MNEPIDTPPIFNTVSQCLVLLVVAQINVVFVPFGTIRAPVPGDFGGTLTGVQGHIRYKVLATAK